jgi:hypothetical protein
MGSKQSTSTSKRTNTRRVNNFVDKRIDQLNNISTHQSSSDAVIIKDQCNTDMSQFKDVAINQMNRVDKPLIKDDLIATICALTPDKHPTPQDLRQLTVKELTLMLRLIIYDPDRYNITQTVEPSAPPLPITQPSAPPFLIEASAPPFLIKATLCNDDVIYIHDAKAV